MKKLMLTFVLALIFNLSTNANSDNKDVQLKREIACTQTTTTTTTTSSDGSSTTTTTTNVTCDTLLEELEFIIAMEK